MAPLPSAKALRIERGESPLPHRPHGPALQTRHERDSESLYRAIIECAPIAIFVCDCDAVIQIYNQAAVALWGREPKCGVEKHCGSLRLYLPDGSLLPHDQTPLRRVIETGIAVSGAEVIVERPDGKRLPVLVSFAPLRDRAGKITGAVTSFHDITERKQAETRLRESEARYQTLFASIDEGFCVTEILYDKAGRPFDLRFLEANPAFEAQSGLRHALGKTLRTLAPGHEDDWFQTYGQVVTSGEPMRFEIYATALHRWFDVYAFRLTGSDSSKAAILFKDITERKETEARLRAATDDLNAEALSLQRLHDLSARLIGTRALPALLDEMLDAAMALEGASIGFVHLRDPATAALGISVQRGSFDGFSPDAQLELHRLSEQALEQRQHVIVADSGLPASDPAAPPPNLPTGYKALHTIPLHGRGGEPLGVVSLLFCQAYRPSDRELRLASLYAQFAADLIEHRQSGEALAQSEAFLQSVIDSTADCIKVLDLDGRMQWMSTNGLCAMEIDDFAAFRGVEWLDFWKDNSTREAASEALASARSDGLGRFQGFCPTARGTPKWWDVVVSPIRAPEGTHHAFLCVSRDITERKRADESLRLSEERYRALLHATTNTVWRMSGDGKSLLELHRNFAAEQVETPTEQSDWLTRHAPPEEQSHIAAKWAEAVANRTLYAHEHTTLSDSGDTRCWNSRAVPMFDDAGDVREWIGASIDITERKRAEEELQRTLEQLESRVAARTEELAASNQRLRQEMRERQQTENARQQLLERLVSAEDDERRRISRELHDQVGQQLTALSLGLKALNAHLSSDVGDAVLQLQQIADNISKEVHDLALELRPTVLDDVGLLAALASYIDAWSARTRILAAFHQVALEPRLPVAVEMNVYRLVQESLTNVARHARGTRVSIVVERRQDELLIIVEDDGVGFDVEEILGIRSPKRLGLIGMMERASACGGTVTFESYPGRGTTVYCHLPLPKK